MPRAMSGRAATERKKPSIPGAPVGFHNRVLQVTDVGPDVLGVTRQFNGVLGTEGHRAHLEEGGGLDPACLFHGYLGQRLSLVRSEGPPLGEPAGEPETVGVGIPEAVATQRPN